MARSPSLTRLKAAFPHHAIELVVQAPAPGANPKVPNLANMSARIAHDIVVIADSDIRVPADYLSARRRRAAATAAPAR